MSEAKKSDQREIKLINEQNINYLQLKVLKIFILT